MLWRRRLRNGGIFLGLLAAFLLLGPANLPPGDKVEAVRAFTRQIEFDYIKWTQDAVGVKFQQLALGANKYLSDGDQHQAVLDYLELVSDIQEAEAGLNDIYADPDIEDVDRASRELRAQLDQLYAQRALLGPLAETVLQSQLSATVADLDFSTGGQPLPPVLFHSTALPWALIVSPREVIRQEANISLQVDLNVEDHVALEGEIESGLDVSTLVVPVGGIGVYPTMIAQTSNLNWLAEVIAHEWMHNYLTLRPLGALYNASPELRTMNETVASIAGTEIGGLLIERFYPELAPPPPAPPIESETASEETSAEPPPFDFRAEMRETRVTVDSLLAEGRIDEAEAYMEHQRRLFWEQGYRIRKLNQAYFAFYGAYADQPGGAQGDDPIGEAVRALRAQSDSLVEFVKRMAWITTVEGLMAAVAR